MNLHHLYIYHTFIDTLKILKYRTPISIFSNFNHSLRNINLKLLVPKVKLDLAKQNFFFQASCIWNEIFHNVFDKCPSNAQGIVVPGSAIDSDLSISIGRAKNKLRDVLLNIQKVDPLRDLLGWSETQDWYPENFFEAHYPV